MSYNVKLIDLFNGKGEEKTENDEKLEQLLKEARIDKSRLDSCLRHLILENVSFDNVKDVKRVKLDVKYFLVPNSDGIWSVSIRGNVEGVNNQTYLGRWGNATIEDVNKLKEYVQNRVKDYQLQYDSDKTVTLDIDWTVRIGRAYNHSAIVNAAMSVSAERTGTEPKVETVLKAPTVSLPINNLFTVVIPLNKIFIIDSFYPYGTYEEIIGISGKEPDHHGVRFKLNLYTVKGLRNKHLYLSVSLKPANSGTWIPVLARHIDVLPTHTESSVPEDVPLVLTGGLIIKPLPEEVGHLYSVEYLPNVTHPEDNVKIATRSYQEFDID
jgi:hypothetical protein